MAVRHVVANSAMLLPIALTGSIEILGLRLIDLICFRIQISENIAAMAGRLRWIFPSQSQRVIAVRVICLAVTGAECNTVIELKLEHHAA